MKTLLWLDDIRPAPDGWAWCRSVNEAIALIVTCALAGEPVTHASLDHDLGDCAADGGDATRLTDWLAEHGGWPTKGLRVHSSNPVGTQAMLATANRYGPYDRPGVWTCGDQPPGGWPPRPAV